MPRARPGSGAPRALAHIAQANAAPGALTTPATEDHARLAATFLGNLPGDQRDNPAARALAATAAALTLEIAHVARALAARGAMDAAGEPDALGGHLARLTRAQIAALRAGRMLPALDKRTLAAGAALERQFRGGRDLAPEAHDEEDAAEAIDWVERLAAQRRSP